MKKAKKVTLLVNRPKPQPLYRIRVGSSQKRNVK